MGQTNDSYCLCIYDIVLYTYKEMCQWVKVENSMEKFKLRQVEYAYFAYNASALLQNQTVESHRSSCDLESPRLPQTNYRYRKSFTNYMHERTERTMVNYGNFPNILIEFYL